MSDDEIHAFAEVFADPLEARHLLQSAGWPAGWVPTWGPGAPSEQFWFEVARQLAAGRVVDGRSQLFAQAAERYPHNPVFLAGVAPTPRPEQAAPERSASLPTPGRILHGAVSGSDVRAVQQALNTLRPSTVQPDGIYGPSTAAAVREFQRSNGLATSRAGVVDRATWDALRLAAGTPYLRMPAPSRLLVPAVSGEDVRELQQALLDAGLKPGPIDGIYGPDTARAVRVFQEVHGLPVDGVVRQDTWEALVSRRLRLSPEVAEALADLGDEPVPPSAFATAIAVGLSRRRREPDAVVPAEPGEVELRPVVWLQHVRALYDTTHVPEIGTAEVLYGLCVLDRSLATRLATIPAGRYLSGAEITERFVLTPRGRWAVELIRDPTPLFERLSPSVLAALQSAEGQRDGSHDNVIRTEHLVSALLAVGTEATASLLRETRVSPEAVLDAVIRGASEHSVTPRSTPVPGTGGLPPMSAHAAAAFDHAGRLADLTGWRTVEERHLLHGVLSVKDCEISAELRTVGLRPGDIEGWDVLGGPTTGPTGPDTRREDPLLLAGTVADTVPEPGAGRVRGADRLDTVRDVEMLVSVLLARDTLPPLAVGLLGDWGSGKSFFMALMQEYVTELAARSKDGDPRAVPFCGEVRQIRFNAWHYVDADLWASLAAALFDALAKEHTADEATEKLQELIEARRAAATASQAREQAEKDEAVTRRRADRAVRVIGSAVGVALRAVRDDKHLRDRLSLNSGTEAERDEAVDQLVASVTAAQDEGHNLRVFWRLAQEEVFHRKPWVTALSVITLVGAAAAAAVLTGWTLAAKVGAFAGVAVAVAGQVIAAVTRLLLAIRDARERREAEVVAAREKLERAREAEEACLAEVARSERDLAALEDRGGRFRDLVLARAASSDYRSRLGVVSTVRRDFEQLVELIDSAARSQTSAEPGASDVVPQVERIILYIDDLDRCPYDKVVEVLQAVHLLLAFRLFVVVVGVDSRWLTRSLRHYYQGVLDDPADYLDKIFQVPFALRPMSTAQYQGLIADLARPREQVQPITGGAGEGNASSERDATADRRSVTEQTGDSPVPPTDTRDDPPEALDGSVPGGTTGLVAPGDTERAPLAAPPPEALVITDPERALLGHLSAAVPTPRAAKRLVNIYRMLRASVPEAERALFDPARGGDEYQVVIVLLSMLVSRPMVAEQVFAELVRAPGDADFWSVLDAVHGAAGLVSPVLREQITVAGVGAYQRWAPRVARFSFGFHAATASPDLVGSPARRSVAGASTAVPPPRTETGRSGAGGLGAGDEPV